VDPFRVSGWLNPDGSVNRSLTSDERAAEAFRHGDQMADSMQWFLLAHELAHVFGQYPERRPSESQDDFSKRRRMAEAAADNFALELLAQLPASELERRFPKGAAYLFLAWVLVLQRSHHVDATNRSHPLNPSRASAVARFVLEKIDTLGLDAADRPAVIEASERTLKLMEQIEADPDFFTALDRTASAQRLSALRADAYMAKRVRSR
jgi:hypothetical protein